MSDKPKKRALSPTQLRVFGMTYLVYIGIYFTRKPISVVKAQMGSDLFADDADGGSSTLAWIDTSFLFFYAIGQFVVGALGDRYGARRLLAAGIVGSALCSFAFGMCTSTTSLLVTWGANGLFQATMYPLSIKALVPHFAPAMRARMLGWWTTAQQVGGVCSVGGGECSSLSTSVCVFSCTRLN
jgi:sugar phosphate permease